MKKLDLVEDEDYNLKLGANAKKGNNVRFFDNYLATLRKGLIKYISFSMGQIRGNEYER